MPLRSETSGEQRAERRVRTRALAADRRGEQSCDEFELSLELPAAHQIVQTRAEFERGHGLRGLLAMIEELNHVRVERRKRIGELVHAPPVPMQVQDAARMFSVDERERIADSRDHPQELARRLQDGRSLNKLDDAALVVPRLIPSAHERTEVPPKQCLDAFASRGELQQRFRREKLGANARELGLRQREQ